MRQFILSIILGLFVGNIAFADINKRQEIFPLDYGAKTSATLNYVLNLIKSTDEATVILTGGEWSITNNVTIPTNVTLGVQYGSYMAVDNGSTVTMTDVKLIAGAYKIFSGAGSATGDADFIYRWPIWGNTTQFDIGDGAINESVVETWIENGDLTFAGGTTQRFDNAVITNLTATIAAIVTANITTANIITANITTGIVDHLTVSNITMSAAVSNSLFSAVTNASGWATAVTDAANVIEVLGYIKGCVPTYVDTNTVTIGVGDGVNNGSYFNITNAITHNITSSIATGTGYVYVAINDTASSYPSSVVLYDTLTAPAYSVANAGWYISTNTSDRVLGTFFYTQPSGGINGTTTNFYADSGGGRIRAQVGTMATLNNNATPNGALAATTTSAAGFLPANVYGAFVLGRGAHAGVNCEIYLSGNSLDTQQRYESFDEVGGSAWLVVDNTAKLVYMGGASGDDNALDCTLLGYEYGR